jgi:hypothetical protein
MTDTEQPYTPSLDEVARTWTPEEVAASPVGASRFIQQVIEAVRAEEREKAAQIVRDFGTEHGWPRDHRMAIAADQILTHGKEQS